MKKKEEETDYKSLKEKWLNIFRQEINYKEVISPLKPENIKYFRPKTKDTLSKLYTDNEPVIKRLATLLNGVFARQTTTFLLSRRILNDMLKLDSNHGINTINSNYYTTLMEYLIKGNIIKELRQQQGRIAGVFQLIDENLLHTMYQDVSIDILNAKETIILEFYDTALKTNKKVKKK